MKRQSRKGFTLIELLVVVAIIALLIAILIPSLGRAKELSNRAACGASLTGICKALNLYSAENADAFPAPILTNNAAGTINKIGVGTVAAISATAQTTSTGELAFLETSASANEAESPLTPLWILVLKGNVSPKSFLCKSDPTSPSACDQTNSSQQFYANFGTINANAAVSTSYSVSYEYSAVSTVGGWWKSTVDSSLPLMADMAPEEGSGTAPYTRNLTATLSTATASSGGVKTLNSNNHSGGEGQNVVFADTHVEFTKNPFVGQGGNNIWVVGDSLGTGGGGTAYANNSTITVPTASSVPYDIIMVPFRNAQTGTSD